MFIVCISVYLIIISHTVLDYIVNYCFRLSRSQGVSDFRKGGGNNEIMLIDIIFTINSA